MDTWDQAGVARWFAQEAARAKLYLDAIRPKLDQNVAYRLLHDEQLATLYVAHYLRRHSCMETRDALCDELREMYEHPPDAPHDVLYPTSWSATWRRHVRWLLMQIVDGALLRSLRPSRSRPGATRPAHVRRA
jgi:hypothetical protein